MTFDEWIQTETIQTPLAPSPTSEHMYPLPLISHMDYFNGELLTKEGFTELMQMLELAFNRGREVGNRDG